MQTQTLVWEMPLVIVTGLVGSGKSTRSERLKTFLESRIPADWRVLIVSDGITHSDASNMPSLCEEKRRRSDFMSSIERLVDAKTVVIADGYNEIKGFRYQLYCIARSAQTPHCVLWCLCSEETSRRRSQQSSLSNEVFVADLCARFEEPNDSTRWDQPLFSLLYRADDPSLTVEQQLAERQMDQSAELQAFEGILETIVGSTARPPTMATANGLGSRKDTLTSGSGASSAATLAQVDQWTQSVVMEFLSKYKTAGGAPTVIDLDCNVSIKVLQTVSISQLQALRRQFIKMYRQRPVADQKQCVVLFAQFLQSNLQI